MYQKAQQFGGRTSNSKGTFGIEDNQGNIVNYHRQALIYGKNIYKIGMNRKIAQKILQ
jgi:hypothetical protein